MSNHAAIAEAVRTNAMTDAPAGPPGGVTPGPGPGLTRVPGTAAPAAPASAPAPEVLVSDLLVEEVSIDGMCGVY